MLKLKIKAAYRYHSSVYAVTEENYTIKANEMEVRITTVPMGLDQDEEFVRIPASEFVQEYRKSLNLFSSVEFSTIKTVVETL